MTDTYVFLVEVYTSRLLISASYTMPIYRRLSDALNSDLTPYISLTDAILAPLDRPQQAQRVEHLLVDRDNILLVTALHEPEPPPDYELPIQTADREVVPIMFLTTAFALQAQFYKRPDLSLSEMLEQRAEEFIAIKEVRVIPFDQPRSIVRDFACLRRAHIEALYPLSAAAEANPHRSTPPDQRE